MIKKDDLKMQTIIDTEALANVFTYPADIIMLPLQIILFVFSMYFFIIGFCGMWRFHEDKILTPSKKFAVLVAAHNEERVIGQLVENLQELNYPKELYDIYVIADNCSDNTAKVAAEAGAIVCKRFDDKKKSKGYALEWMFEKLFEMEKSGKIYDAVAIFDADNLVHPQFLIEMNNRLMKGDKIIQGFLDAKNPYDTWVSGTFAIAFWVIDHVSHLAKTNNIICSGNIILSAGYVKTFANASVSIIVCIFKSSFLITF